MGESTSHGTMSSRGRADPAVIFPCGDLASHSLAAALYERGARVRTVVAYRTLPGRGIAELAARALAGEIDAVVFASPSSIQFAATALQPPTAVMGSRPIVVCIGPSTARAAREFGLEPDATARSQSVGGIVEALERCAAHRRRATAPMGS